MLLTLLKQKAIRTTLVLVGVLHGSLTLAADWYQWRGGQRSGVDQESPVLVNALPEKGLQPVWYVSEDDLPAAAASGWSSPVVSGDSVYLFTHKKKALTEVKKLPPLKFPYLPPEKRGGMTEEEYAEYEVNRRNEQEARAKGFRFDEFIYCLDRKNGKLKWVNEYSSLYTRFAQSGSPTVVDGKLYVLSAGRTARAVDAENGETLWMTKIPGDFRDQYLQSSFAVDQGLAIVLCDGLFALDVKSGEVVWEYTVETRKNIHCSPVIWKSEAGARVICNLAGGMTVCLDLKSGTLVWEVESGAGNATPIITGNKLILYGQSRKSGLVCYELKETTPDELWRFNGAADSGSTPVAVDGLVFVQGDRRLACVDLATGKPKWQTMLDLNRPRYTSLIAADEKVFYAFDGILAFEAGMKYKPLMQAKINRDGVLANESDFRNTLGIDELEKTAEGQIEAEVILRKEFSNGPLVCTTPAISDGFMFVRLKRGIACYDLRN
ncbi:MAG: PQQ-binding-like beta-propeller repeat protein [Planctomycetota bacterium]|nr:PQQ-binding-like beta-propeller repeat protein [Planctomycetota bacterium]